MVKQNGVPCAFCHRNRYTCWGHRRGLGELEETLASRLVSAPEGSYTKRLFDDASFLRDKLLEEAQELMEAELDAARMEVSHVSAASLGESVGTSPLRNLMDWASPGKVVCVAVGITWFLLISALLSQRN